MLWEIKILLNVVNCDEGNNIEEKYKESLSGDVQMVF